jgi:hypothetical protein
MNSDLMRAYNFSPDDLAQNKQGRLSPRQVSRLKKNNRIGAILMFIFLLVTAPFTVIVLRPLVINGVSSFVDDFFRIFGGGVLLLLSLLFFFNLFKFLLRTNNPVVTKVEGVAQGIISRKEKTTDSDGGAMYVTVYYVLIGEQEVQVQQRHTSLFQEGYTYAVYKDKVLGIVSVEQLGGLEQGDTLYI